MSSSEGQFYSDGTRVVNCQFDRMSNHTKIHLGFIALDKPMDYLV